MPVAACIYVGGRREPGACEIYRSNMPLHFLGQSKAWQVQWQFMDELIALYVLEGPRMWQQVFEGSDIFIFPRAYAKDGATLEAFDMLFAELRRNRKKIVYEVDDDYTNEHREVIEGDAISLARKCDAVTVSTPLLGEMMTDRTGLPHYVLPNMIDPHLWAGNLIDRPAPPEELLILLSGSKTHYADWRVLETVFPPILKAHPRARLILAGFHPEYLHDLPNVTRVPGLPYPQYADLVRQCDIVLAPVIPTDGFNAYKSPIKAVEGMGAKRLVRGKSAGAAVIATDNAVYRLAVRHGESGLLVEHTPAAWSQALETLLTDEPLRHRLQERGYRHCWKHFDISRRWTQWAKAYHSILSVR